MVSMFVDYGPKNRGDFYKYLVENGIYTPQIAEMAKPYLDEDKDKKKDNVDDDDDDWNNTPFGNGKVEITHSVDDSQLETADIVVPTEVSE